MLRIDEQFVFDHLEACGSMPEITEAVTAIKSYRITDFYESKNNLLADWEIDHKGIYDMIISVFTQALINDRITYQALVGMLNHKIKLDEEIDRVKIFADIIGLISVTGLIDITSEVGEYHYISTDYEIDDIPVVNKHETITAIPKHVESNWYAGKSILLGHSMNHHDGYLRLSHIERMNQIPLTLNQRFISQYTEAPKHDPEGIEEEEQFEVFKEDSMQAYEEIGTGVYYDDWRYCCRGRSYSGSYYVGIQGSSYKKSIIELANKEVVGGF